MLAAAGAIVLALLVGMRVTNASSAVAGAAEKLTPQTDASVPARDVTMIGSSPAEAPGETWGVGRYDGAPVVVRYTTESGWSQLAPGFLDDSGQPLSGFKLAQPEGYKYPNPSPLAGQMTPDGSGALLGTIPEEGKSGVQRVLLMREPGGPFVETAPVPAEGEAALKPGEALFGNNRAPLLAALEEPGAPAHAGALVVPVDEESGVDDGVLHWSGATKAWTREPIEIPAASASQFEVLGIAASSPGNAWLVARLSSAHYPVGSIALFRRHLEGGGGAVWRAVTPTAGGEPGEPLAVPGSQLHPVASEALPVTVGSGVQAQILTVTAEGLWIDARRSDVQASTTMFFKPEGETSGGVLAAWCKVPASAPASVPQCNRQLPEALPTGPSRSFAWAAPSTPEALGERVITGLPDGVSLRLDGTEFKTVLSLGGEAGGDFGAAFSAADNGWLGKELLPVHLTTQPLPSQLTAWPVSFRHALLAIAPEPGATVGSTSSQALAVGDQGEVARYEPGKGWLPESLLGPGGHHETPLLRAVAWPTSSRAYAVGDPTEGKLNQMWLWRAETGLWEPDPAQPVNFRGYLLGIAFDPDEPGRGYVVGQAGVLLRSGKTWIQEQTCAAGVPQPCLPPEVADANFTSIAFAGSEAIVAYRKLVSPGEDRYEGGLLVNEGSGWKIDQGAAAAMGPNVPWAVAGLPDGGAAFTASGIAESAQVYERQSAGAPWQVTAAPFPGGGAPGSLALFREGGALRAITAGSQPYTFGVEDEQSPPPGLPPNFVEPYPLASNAEQGVLRQTATGWSDEEHELDDAREPPGEYLFYDTPYQPDPVAAVLVDPTGSQGWAVGGVVNGTRPLLDTADVWGYPADGLAPVGIGSAPVTSEPGMTTFAIGGGAQCAAPCAARAQTRIGPDVWLSSALARAEQISGVRAFFYTGPRVTTGATAGPATLVIPYKQELERYAEVLGSGSPGSLPTYVAAGPTDLEGAQSEGFFAQAFAGFHQPFGGAEKALGLPSASPAPNPGCGVGAPGCQASYYALAAEGAVKVRVIVLDMTTDVGSDQLAWLERQLTESHNLKQPAIVVGQADLAAQITAGDGAAAHVAQALVCDHASAYFFDATEQNVHLPLRASCEGSTEGSVETFGSGTLGYVNYAAEERGGFIGASGFLLAEVDVSARNPATNVAPVRVRLIPNIGELALEAEDGTLLRRSNAALFAALARRPRSGNRAHRQAPLGETETSPYIPIPSNCVGSACATGILPEYTFSSSHPDLGGFVVRNLASTEPNAVLENSKGEPIPDEPRNPKGELIPGGRFDKNAKGEPINERGEPVPAEQSSLFCAYNAGTTTVTISAGGLSYSLPVTVQAGSVRQPCGTTPLTELPVKSQSTPAPVPPPAPSPAGPAPASAAPPPVPPPPPPPVIPVATTPPPPVRPTPASPMPFFIQPALPFVAIPFVPPPLPAPAEPTPPSGTSAVTSPVEAAQKEEEQEEATESVSNQAVAYRAPEHEPSPAYGLGIVLLAAFAGASVRKRMRGGRRELRVAPATLSTMRAQRRMSPRRGRHL